MDAGGLGRDEQLGDLTVASARGLAAQQAGRELMCLAAAQPGQVQPQHPAEPVQLGEHRAQRVPSVQLIGAERSDDQHFGQNVLVGDQEGQQVTSRPVGSVGVLDHQDERAALGQVLEQGEHLLEHSRSRLIGVAFPVL
jgi:hypothetical protein